MKNMILHTQAEDRWDIEIVKASQKPQSPILLSPLQELAKPHDKFQYQFSSRLLLLILSKMAMVFRAERDLSNPQGDLPPNIGPGSYIGHSYLRAKPAAAPFNSQVTRSKPLKQDSAPGPGSYNVDFVSEGQKVVLQSAQSEVKILEIPRQQSVFASKSRRFQDKVVMETPGPGAYESSLSTKPIQQQYTSQHYIEELLKLNRYQSIPSIPASNQVYGYTEKGNHDLELNKSPVPTFSGLKQDTVGPGQYQLKDTFDANKHRGPAWHKSRVPKLAPAVSKDKELIVGPGAYDHDSKIIPLHKLNPSGAFLSKSQRMFDMQKGKKAQEFQKLHFEQQKKKLMQNPAFQYMDDGDIEFVDDATPGPGHYYPNTTSISTASHYSQSVSKIASKAGFGSRSKRFKEHDQPGQQVGPGTYDMQLSLIKPPMQLNYPPFLSSNTRFESKVLERRPGPQSYDPKVSLEDQLVKKLERAPVGKFGSNQPRFREGENEVPGPGAYDDKSKEPPILANCVFKSQTKRQGLQSSVKDQFPAPGAYEAKNHTIELAVRVEKEEDPDLRVKKPGFGSSMPRFSESPQRRAEEEDEDEPVAPMKHNASDLFIKKGKEHPAFNTQEKRFVYEDKKVLVPGPGEYHDPQQNPWDKKTFNIYYQEI